MSIVTSLLVHTSSKFHWPPRFETRNPVTGRPRPETMMVWPWMIGVTALLRGANGVGTPPQQLAGSGRDADEIFLRHGDDLPRAAELRGDRRSIRRTIAVPAPAHVAGARVERGQRAVAVAADVHDDQAAIDQRRHRGVIQRLHRPAGLLPQLLAGGRVERRDGAGHAERIEPPVGKRRCGLRSGAVRARGRGDSACTSRCISFPRSSCRWRRRVRASLRLRPAAKTQRPDRRP